MDKIKKFFQKIWYWLTYPYYEYKRRQELKKRLEELKKRDPFIYK